MFSDMSTGRFWTTSIAFGLLCLQSSFSALKLGGRNSPLKYLLQPTAVLKGNPDIVDLLLQHNDIDVNHQPDIFYQYLLKYGKYTVLTKGLHLKNEAIMKLLLSHKDIDANKADIHGCTPLGQACSNGDGEHHNIFSFSGQKRSPRFSI